jgi:hypothetical protein
MSHLPLALWLALTGATQPARPADEPAPNLPAAIARGTEVVLSLEDKDRPGEWPYEGVYRVDGEIPIGYRVGGTGICAITIMSAPDFEKSDAEKAAVQRALAFTLKGLDEPLMSPTAYDAGYDVRGWGYTYALTFMLRLKEKGLVAEGDKERVEKSIRWCIDALQTTEIPEVGGWNYARPPGKNKVAPPSPFMTAPTLQALFEAKKAGYEVDEKVVTRALDFLESAREPSGGIVYSGKGANGKQGVPGAVGRMLASESVLYLAGRGSQANIRAAVDAYIVHWDWLNQRRAKPGTHMGPYQIAPYYFYYAHYYAALAVELLPEHERAEYRRRINELLMKTRHEDGSWNDRVFARSANYGTSMAVMAMLMPQAPRPAGWGAKP